MQHLTTYYPNGNPYIVEYRVDGKRQYEVSIYDIKGNEICFLWYDNGLIDFIKYYQNGKQHNLHGPAYMEWFDNNQIKIIGYRQNDKLHNLHGPAYMEWSITGLIHNIEYRQNNTLHNLHTPAHIEYWRDTSKFSEIQYYHFGKLHRLHGPADISWYDDEQYDYIAYRYYGKLIYDSLIY